MKEFILILHQAFWWPSGAVIGNLAASLVVWLPNFIWLHFAHKKLHRKIEGINGELHSKIKGIHVDL